MRMTLGFPRHPPSWMSPMILPEGHRTRLLSLRLD